MSKVKPNIGKQNSGDAKKKPPVSPHGPGKKNKKNTFFKDTCRKKKQGRPQPVQQAPLAPPKDPQLFSANWKALLEVGFFSTVLLSNKFLRLKTDARVII